MESNGGRQSAKGLLYVHKYISQHSGDEGVARELYGARGAVKKRQKCNSSAHACVAGRAFCVSAY